MVYHKHDEKNSSIYVINGFFMAIAFGIFRIYYYHFMIFEVLVHYVLYRTGSFWSVFYKDKYTQWLVTFSIIMYLFMYILQLYWFT